jgi:HPt (histidine-containing phosphotransfer) domain-containing protein
MADSGGFARPDFGALERTAGGDEALVLEVLGLFEGQAPVWTSAMTATTDAAAWRAAAHSLKGSAMAIGAMALGEACEAAEAAAAVDAAVRQPLGERVKAALAAALVEIAVYRAERAG